MYREPMFRAAQTRKTASRPAVVRPAKTIVLESRRQARLERSRPEHRPAA
jgi:hypothetical protein